MGQFVKGQSGNPGGRPKGEKEVLELAREASPRAIGRLIELVDSTDPRTAIAAANSVLDRAFGKPTQTLASDPDNPVVPDQAPAVETLAKLTAKDRADIRAILGRAAG